MEMGVVGEEQLRCRAEAFRQELRHGGFEAEILEESFRDYSVKLSLHMGGELLGRWIINYSPKRGTFTPGTQEIRTKSRLPELDRFWSASRGGPNDAETPVKPAALVPPIAGEFSKWEVYTDGSALNGAVTYGYVILENGGLVQEGSGVAPEEFTSSRQVGGEIFAVLEAVQWCSLHGSDRLTIHYDFANLEQWATGKFRANTPISRRFVEQITASPVEFLWRKVVAHSGDRWNEHVDYLAKQAAKHPSQVVIKPPDSEARAEVPVHEDLCAELERTVRLFEKDVRASGIEIRFLGVFNQNFGRLEILDRGKRVGYFDLYNTQYKRLSPIITASIDSQRTNTVLSLWNSFRAAPCIASSKEDEISSGLERVDYFYRILEPYALLRFDFISLAEEVVCAYENREIAPPFSADDARFDFGRLAAAYHALRSMNNG